MIKKKSKIHKYIVIPLGILLLLNMLAFYSPLNPYNTKAILNSAQGVQIPDIMVFYSPDQLFQFLTQIQETGRNAFQGLHRTVDLSFPIIYSLFFFYILQWQVGIIGKPRSFLPWISILAGGFDLVENFTLFYITSQFPSFLHDLSIIAQVITIIKFALILTCILIILIMLWKSIIKNRNQ